MRRKVKTKAVVVPAKPKLQVDPAKKLLLHIESGPQHSKPLPLQFNNAVWQEVRLDSRATAKPDIMASLPHLAGVADKQFHGVWVAGGALEHLHAHEIPEALYALYRVLQPGGTAFLMVHGIQKIAEYIAKGNLERPLYQSPKGIVTAIDILYGAKEVVQAGNGSLVPHTAFTAQTLAEKLAVAGFGTIQVIRKGAVLWAVAHKLPQGKPEKPQIQIQQEDVNKMMRDRDELDKEPEIWKGFPA